ncbi:hypothetical protein MKC73_03315 [[Clostridium] innocuum]|nr:hypothetical protein [[Clostridium] innocuum]
MSWFEKSTNRMIQHRLGTTYQMSLLLELFLAFLSFVLLADRVSSMSFFFGIVAVLVAARIIFLYAVMSLGIETRIVYGIMLLLQALITTILFFTASIFIFVIVSILIVALFPILTYMFCRKMAWFDK